MKTKVFLAFSVACAFGQTPKPTPAPPALVSPEVHTDRTVTFRFRDPYIGSFSAGESVDAEMVGRRNLAAFAPLLFRSTT